MIREYLKEHILITDGAMGTYYDRKKSENGRIAEEANLLEPELITRIHEEYLEQGARLIRTNTFAANHAMALGRGVRDRREQDAYVKHVIRAAWKLAQKAAENRPEEIFVAADIGPAAENLFSEYETDPAAEYRFLADCFLVPAPAADTSVAALRTVLPLLLHRPPPGAHVPGQSENIRTVPQAIFSPAPSVLFWQSSTYPGHSAPTISYD